MGDKRSAFFTIVVIGAIIGVFAVADLIQEDRLFSQTENRVLAARPGFSWEGLLRGDYAEAYEAYLTDQFVSLFVGNQNRYRILVNHPELPARRLKRIRQDPLIISHSVLITPAQRRIPCCCKIRI